MRVSHARRTVGGVRGCETVMAAARSRVYTGPCVRACKHGHVDGPKTVPYLFEYRVVQVAAQKPSLTANRDFGLLFHIIFVVYCYTYNIMFFGL